MKFAYNQFLKFRSNHGSYSKVTPREFYDSQITTTDAETQLMVDYFGISEIHIGNVNSNREKSRKRFLLYPNGEEIFLNLVYPKPEKTELRLYISERAGFKPEAESIWFLFIRNKEIWIGSMNEDKWRKENSGLIIDDYDSFYQSSLLDESIIKTSTLKAKGIFTRSRELAIKRMKIEKYQCEFDPKHNLFISRGTKLPYLESHHLVPISLQKSLDRNLDILENIYCLCPFCHRAIHHAEIDCTKQIIDRLLDKRHSILDHLKFDPTDLYQIYAVEEITG
jgi:hypothetical protein